jgi:hypothetical protein
MDMSAYELGCPAGHSWANDDCTRMGETANGHLLTREESDKECLILDALGGQLKSHGYCWIKVSRSGSSVALRSNLRREYLHSAFLNTARSSE